MIVYGFLGGEFMKHYSKILSVALVFFLFSISFQAKSAINKDLKKGELNKTVVTPFLNKNIKKDENLIYNPAFKVSWNKLKNNTKEKTIRLSTSNSYADKLNNSNIEEKALNKNYYINMYGYKKDNIVNAVREALDFNLDIKEPVIDTLVSPQDMLVYSCFKRNIKFNNEFENIPNAIEFENNGKITRVSGFGIAEYRDEEQRKIAEQVQVLSYDGMDDFIIKLQPQDLKEEIIIAKIKPEDTLEKTMEKAEEKIKRGEKSSLKFGETLAIPNFDIDIETDYKQIEKQKFINKGFENTYIGKATENTKFKMVQKGLIVTSKFSEIILKKKAKKRWFVCDKPFLVYIKIKGSKKPYFAVWVNNPEVLIKYF